jgi:diguanylate cyclase (GGDEF)-like protein
VVHDPVVTVTADGAERVEAADRALLGGTLHDLLDTGSMASLRAAIARAPVRNVELTTVDGRVLDATVVPVADGTEVVLRDVSGYAAAAEQLGSMAVSLARRNRDLRTLYEAAASLDATLDLDEIAARTCALVGGYLDADRVEVTVLDTHGRWVPGADDTAAAGTPPLAADDLGPPRDTVTLRTARGPLGELRWWRRSALLANEAETLPLLLSRAAIGLDHALLLSNAEERAARDPLTGLLNRAGAHRALGRLVRPYALALLDLDRFKAVNDDHGHAEGDRVLREVATILAGGRGSDVKARWGGEEFLVALEHASADELASWVEARLDEVRTGVSVGGIPVTFSAGVAVVHDEGLDAALQAADAALYRAKDAGRDRVERPVGSDASGSAPAGSAPAGSPPAGGLVR